MNTKESLIQKYPYKIEMHAHSSPCSYCSEVSPEDVVRLYKERGYDAVVFVNHFLFEFSKDITVERHLSDYHRACQAGKELGLTVLLGAEIRFTENSNDYLIYGVDEALLRLVYDHLDGGIDAFRRNVPLKDSVFVQAHPFRPNCKVVDAALLDGVEVFNLHPHHNSNIQVAQEFAAANPQLIQTAGSDFHHDHPGHCGSTALRSSVIPKDSFELAQILKSGDYVLQLHNSIYLP